MMGTVPLKSTADPALLKALLKALSDASKDARASSATPSEPEQKTCALCAHKMTFEQCGSASAYVGDDCYADLCHADSHSCYHQWTVYGERPQDVEIGPTE